MSALVQALDFVLQTLLGLLSGVFLLRFYLQCFNAPFHNPLSQAVVALTNFAVRPARRVIPAWGGLDSATLALAFLVQWLLLLANLWLHDFPLWVAGAPVWLALLGMALLGVVKLTIYIFLYAVLLEAILSWVNPRSPLAPVLGSLTGPLLRPLRKRIPLVGQVDLTPLMVFIAAELLLMLLVMPLEQQLLRFF